MRAYEFINESNEINNTAIFEPGWQEPTYHDYGQLGFVILGDKLNNTGELVESKFLYYNPLLLNAEYSENVVYGIVIRNNRIIEYDYLENPNGKDIGQYYSKNQITNLFSLNVYKYMNKGQIMKENNSLNKTPDIKSPEDIYKLMPGLKERMEQSLDNHGKLYFKLTEEYKSNNKEPK